MMRQIALQSVIGPPRRGGRAPSGIVRWACALCLTFGLTAAAHAGPKADDARTSVNSHDLSIVTKAFHAMDQGKWSEVKSLQSKAKDPLAQKLILWGRLATYCGPAEFDELSAFLYAQMSAFFLAVFLIKYRIEYLLSLPFFALLFAVYFRIGLKANSAAQQPERLYKEAGLMVTAGVLFLLLVVLSWVDIPLLERLAEPHFLVIE